MNANATPHFDYTQQPSPSSTDQRRQARRRQTWGRNPHTIWQLAAEVVRLKRIMDGEGTDDAPGLRKRVAELEKLAEELRQLRFALHFAVGLLTLLGGGNLVATLIQLLRHVP